MPAKKIDGEYLAYLETAGLPPEKIAAELGFKIQSIENYYKKRDDPRRFRYAKASRQTGEVKK